MLTPDDRKELDFEKLGPVLEALVNSDRVSDEERRAIELCARAAVDLLSIEHEQKMKDFYSRPKIQRIETQQLERWLDANKNAAAGVSVLTHGRWYVSSYEPDGKLQLTPIDPPWPLFPDAPE
tara:strand:- start:3511 stop:3879 length:369 start_codon:yes stop_codon:yes gene_type:complete